MESTILTTGLILRKRISAVALMQILPIGDSHVQETMIGFEPALYTARPSIA